MPIYIYQHPTNESIVEVFQSMKDVHEYEDNGVKYKRLFSSPAASVDTNINPDSSKEFCNKLANKNYTVGDLWDKSKELSDKRAAREGTDPIRDKYFEKYRKEHKGQEHPHQKKEKLAALQRELGISIGLR